MFLLIASFTPWTGGYPRIYFLYARNVLEQPGNQAYYWNDQARELVAKWARRPIMRNSLEHFRPSTYVLNFKANNRDVDGNRISVRKLLAEILPSIPSADLLLYVCTCTSLTLASFRLPTQRKSHLPVLFGFPSISPQFFDIRGPRSRARQCLRCLYICPCPSLLYDWSKEG